MTIKESRPKETNTLIDATEVRYIKSAFVDQEFRICIGPGWYTSRGAQPAGKVPVIYVLDGNIEVIRAVRGMHFGGELPPALVVAIGYPFESPAPLRFRDLSPASDPAFEQRFGIRSGGAADFLRFIAEELKPFIESGYDVDPADATLVGGSLGGVFATYVLLGATDTFQRYCIVSPALSYGDEVCFKQEASYAASHADLPAKVFIGAGEREDEPGMAKYVAAADGPGSQAPKIVILEHARRFARQLAARRYPSLDLRFEVFPKETHGSIFGVAVSWGLRCLFGTLDP